MGIKLDMTPEDHYMIDNFIGIGLQPSGFYKENIMEMCYMPKVDLEYSEMFQ